MLELKLLITIVRRDLGDAFLNYLKNEGVAAVFINLCNGTASKNTLDFLGIERTEKLMLTSLVNADSVKKLMRGMVRKLDLETTGYGITLSIPTEAIGGKSCLEYLTEGQRLTRTEAKEMEQTPFTLIVIIAAKGSTDTVMDAARAAGARGGTVIHAKGTATEFTKRFFGVSIADEKELIYIVAKRADTETIMKAVMKDAGLGSDAHSAIFTLPVESVAGLRALTDED